MRLFCPRTSILHWIVCVWTKIWNENKLKRPNHPQVPYNYLIEKLKIITIFIDIVFVLVGKILSFWINLISMTRMFLKTGLGGIVHIIANFCLFNVWRTWLKHISDLLSKAPTIFRSNRQVPRQFKTLPTFVLVKQKQNKGKLTDN